MLISNKLGLGNRPAELRNGLPESVVRGGNFFPGLKSPSEPPLQHSRGYRSLLFGWWRRYAQTVVAVGGATTSDYQYLDTAELEGLELPVLQHRPAMGWAKRATDIFIALTSLVLLAPVIIAAAIAIKITMGSPVIFAHQRVGRNGIAFRCFKLRTMVNNASEVLQQHLKENSDCAWEWRQERKLARDPRVLGIGRFLRRSSIDELPQLFNVLRGEMSCVGPRPIVADELERYGKDVMDRLSVRPGLTGLWQVSGRNSLDYEDRVKLDMLYVRRWSMLLDIAILLKTIPAVMNFDDTT